MEKQLEKTKVTTFTITNLKNRIGAFFGLIALSIFSWIQFTFVVIPGCEKYLSESLEINKIENFMNIMWYPIIGYLLLSGALIFIVILLKGKLKSFNSSGLFSELFNAFILGIIGGFLCGVAMSNLVPFFILGLVIALIYAAFSGFIKELT